MVQDAASEVDTVCLAWDIGRMCKEWKPEAFTRRFLSGPA